MVAACAALGVGADAVEVVDDPRLRDGPGTNWPKEAVAERVSTAVERWGISKVLTFDAAGASGHPNPIATHHHSTRVHRGGCAAQAAKACREGAPRAGEAARAPYTSTSRSNMRTRDAGRSSQRSDRPQNVKPSRLYL